MKMEAPHVASSHRVPHISIACTACRRAKKKCSGERPACTTCTEHGKECDWPANDMRSARRQRQGSTDLSALLAHMQLGTAVHAEPSAASDATPQYAFTQHCEWSMRRGSLGFVMFAAVGLSTSSLPNVSRTWTIILPSAVAASLTDWTHHEALHLALDAAQWQLRVIRALFLDGMAASPQVSKHYSPALHCAVLATAGAFVSEAHPLRGPSVRAELAQAAYARVLGELVPVPALSTARALALLATHFGDMPGHVDQAEVCFRMALWVLGQVPVSTPEDALDVQCCRASLFMQDVDFHSTPQLTTMAYPIPSAQDLAAPPTTDHLLFLSTLELYKILARAHLILSDASAQAEREALISLLQDWHACLPPGLLTSAAILHPLAGTLHITALWAKAVVHGLCTIPSVPHFQSAYVAAATLIAATATYKTRTPPVARVLALDAAAVVLRRLKGPSGYAHVVINAAQDCALELRALQPTWRYSSAPADAMERFIARAAPFVDFGLLSCDADSFSPGERSVINADGADPSLV